ncbi:MAG: hypothetical protein JJ916_15365, partial [Phycisphaerales bacterium]|nr:hypothetical protein [Phycisphaerales bacterium]
IQMNRIVKADTASKYTWDHPEDGKWWHKLDHDGAKKFHEPQEFGKESLSETTGTDFHSKKCIRVRPSREEIEVYPPKDGKILSIDPGSLTEGTDWINAGKAGDRFVLGSVAQEHGLIMDSSEGTDGGKEGNR